MSNLDTLLGLDDQSQTRHTSGISTSAFVSTLGTSQNKVVQGLESFNETSLFDSNSAGKDQSASAIAGIIKSAAMNAGFESFQSEYAKETGSESRAAQIANSMIKSATIAALMLKDGTGNALMQGLRGVTTPAFESSDNDITKLPVLNGDGGTVRTTTYANEDYDNKPIEGFWLLTVGFNFAALRQDAFAENLFPSTAVAPTKGGIIQEITFPTIFRDRKHTKDASLLDLKERMLLDAIRDPDVMQNESTRIFPAYTDEVKHVFVDGVEPEVKENLRGITYKTNYLKFGVDPFSMLSLATQHYDSGAVQPGISYAIDPAIVLEHILVKIGDQLVDFDVTYATQSKFQEKQTDHVRYAELSFKTDTQLLTNKTTDITGKPVAALASLGDDETVALSISAHGSLNCTYGDTDILAGAVRIKQYFNEAGEVFTLKAGKGEALKKAMSTATLVGYKLNQRLVNTNQVERGLLMETRTFRHRLVLPFKYPITHVASPTTNEGDAASIIESLTMAVYVQNSIDAVKTLLNYANVVKGMASRDKKGVLKRGDIDGILGHLFKPTYIEVDIDMLEKVDSIRSMDRFADVNSVLMNTIASVLYPARRESNIDAAYKAHSKNQDEKPTWIINTDSNIVNYLMVQGDNRTLGPDMDYILNATNCSLMDDKIIIVPTSKTRGENNPLTFGTFYNAPSIVTKLPQSRDQEHNLEYRVTPVNLHVPNQPFMVVINVKNLAKVIAGSVPNTNTKLNGYTGTQSTQSTTGQQALPNTTTNTGTNGTGTGTNADGSKTGG